MNKKGLDFAINESEKNGNESAFDKLVHSFEESIDTCAILDHFNK